MIGLLVGVQGCNGLQGELLTDSDGHLCPGLDLCDRSGSYCILGVLPDVDVSSQLRSSTLVHNIGRNLRISDNRGVLLARVDRRAITGQLRVDLI